MSTAKFAAWEQLAFTGVGPANEVDRTRGYLPLLRWSGDVLLLAVFYAGTALLGLAFAIPPGYASAIWPPSGLAFAALVLRSRNICPGIWLGAFAANMYSGGPVSAAAIIATGNTAAALLAATMCKRVMVRGRMFNSPKDAFCWLMMSAISCGVAASVGVATLVMHGVLHPVAARTNWLTWWLGDVTGVMILTPAIIALFYWRQSEQLHHHRFVEYLAAYGALALASIAVFCGWLPESTAKGMLYLPVILSIWLLLAFGLEVVLVGNALVAAIAMWGTAENFGPFGNGSQAKSLLDLQVFLNVYAFTSLTLSGVLAQGRDSELRRRRLVETLRINDERMAVAHDIQRSLFPTKPVEDENYSCAGVWRPAEQATGDYFDIVAQPDGSVVLVIADVCGHGIGPALLMAETRAYVRALLMGRANLAEKFRRLNRFLHDDTTVGKFVTLAMCKLCPNGEQIEFLGAGHTGVVVRQDGTIHELEAATIPLGLEPELPSMESTQLPMNAGDSIFLYTDGLIEAKSADQEMFGKDRLLESLKRHHHRSPIELLNLVVGDVAAYSHQKVLEDDQTAVLLRVR